MNTPDTATDWRPETQAVADRIRTRVLDHVLRSNGGYMSQALSSAEIFAMLYTGRFASGRARLRWRPVRLPASPARQPRFFNGGDYNGPKAADLDRFIFSPAHYALVLYTALIETGRLAEEGLDQFNQDGTTVEMIGAEHSPGR